MMADSEEPKDEGKYRAALLSDVQQVIDLLRHQKCEAAAVCIEELKALVSTHNAVPSVEAGEVAKAVERARTQLENIESHDEIGISHKWAERTRELATYVIMLALAIDNAVRGERAAISARAREISGHYEVGSDGRNTFILLAEWIEGRST